MNLNFKKLLRTDSHKKYTVDIGWQLLDKLIRFALGIWFAGMVGHYLGPERFGVLNYAVALIAFIEPIAFLGIGDLVTREIVKNHEKRHEILSTSLVMRLIASVLSIFFIILYAFFSSEETEVLKVLYIIGGSLVFKLLTVTPHFYLAIVQNRIIVITGLIVFVVSLILKILCVYVWQTSLYAFAWISVFESFFVFLLQSGYYIKVYSWFWRINLKLIKPFLKEGIWIVFAGISGTVNAVIDSIMLKQWLGAKEVGLYTASNIFNSYYYFFPVIICVSLFPALVRAFEHDKGIYQQKMLMLYSLLTYVTIVYCMGIYFLGESFFLWFYGAEYTLSVELLTIRSLSMLGVCWGTLFGRWVIIEKGGRILSYKITMGMFVNIIGNAYWIPKAGMVGAAWMTVISVVIVDLIADLFWKKSRKQFKLKLLSFGFPVYFIYNEVTKRL